MPRGGIRENSGRTPAGADKRKASTFHLLPSVRAALADLAAKTGRSQASIVEALIEQEARRVP